MKTRHAAVFSILSASIATNPCDRLCQQDADCTQGSWPRNDICHAYFSRNGGYCYHKTETRLTCPDTLPALTVTQAQAILDQIAGASAIASSTSVSPSPRMRRVIPVGTTTTEAPETTESTTVSTTESTTETSTTPGPARRRRVFPVGQAAAPTPSSTTVVDESTPAPEQRRRRVFPVGQTAPQQPVQPRAVQPRQTWTTTVPPGYYNQYSYSSSRVVSVPQSFSTPLAAADYIGTAFDGRVSFDEFTAQIAVALSREDMSSWPATVTNEEAMEFWTRARGADLFALASATNSCGAYGANECGALLLLISYMPLPNTDENASILFLEQVGVMAFVDTNIAGIRSRLQGSTRELTFGAGGLNLDNRGLAVFRGFARNWPSRFPQIIQDSTPLRAVVLRQRIYAMDLLNNISGYVSQMSLDIDRRQPLLSASRQFSRYTPPSIRAGIQSVRYSGEQAGGQGLTNEFFSVMAQATFGESSEAIFATHTISGFERMINGIVAPERYRAFGQFMALAVLSGNPTGIPLPPMFFRRLLGYELSLADVRVFDEDWYTGAIHYMNAATQEDIRALNLGDDEPLAGSGSDEPLTIENRHEQMQRAIDNVLTNNSPVQFAQIAEGFFSVLPRELFTDIEGEDLQAMVVGNLEVSATDLLAHLTLELPTLQAQWLRQIVTEFTPALRQRFLRFVTGLSVVPVGGWDAIGHLRVSSANRIGSDGRIALPRSQTCFKSMYMPLYDNIEEMREIITNVILYSIDAGMQER